MQTPDTQTAVVIVAAGRGTRAGGGLAKQWRPLAGRPVLWHALQTFDTHPRISRIVLVLHPDDIAHAPLPPIQADIVTGGADRRASVLAGLKALEGQADRVLIHDAARPMVSADTIDAVIDALDHHPGAAPALPVDDALWRGARGLVSGTQTRDGLYRAQTPQGFHLNAILDAHRAHPGPANDDVEVARAAGLAVKIVAGSERNFKITHPRDFPRAEQLLRTPMDIRLGNGFDVHRFGPGDHVTLCGIVIAHHRGLVGHSDADVGMHALTDAIYGALAEGDIGRHFPPSDPQWKGAASKIFLEHAVSLAANRGFQISNADVTLICERPKIGPHAADMEAELSKICRLDIGRISVKATTSEQLGFTGREEGIAALATATLIAP